MGPKTSPLKRASEDTEGAGMENKKKRRKKLKHELIGEGWGELPKYQGAEEVGEQAHPFTLKQGSRSWKLKSMFHLHHQGSKAHLLGT